MPRLQASSSSPPKFYVKCLQFFKPEQNFNLSICNVFFYLLARIIAVLCFFMKEFITDLSRNTRRTAEVFYHWYFYFLAEFLTRKM